MSDENKNKLDDYGIFLLSGDIDDEIADDAVRFILEANLNGEHDHITLIINSLGGFIGSGFAITDIIAGSKIPVHTVGLGQIASAALNIFIAGEQRRLTPNTLIMSHQWFGYHRGKEHELLAQQKQDEITTKQIIKHYITHTGLSEKKVRKILFPAHDVYLTSEEALELGLCDEVKNFNETSKVNKKWK